MPTVVPVSEKGKQDDSENVFNSPDCPVKKVTVYADRAEVCRTLEVRVQTGVNEINLRNLPTVIDEDSIRVEGQGHATIAEVFFRTRHVTAEKKQAGEEEKELEKQRQELQGKKEEIEARQSIIKNQWDILNKFSESVTKPEKEQAAALGDQYFKGVTGFLALYGTEAQRLETARMEVQHEVEVVNQKLEAVMRNLNEIQCQRQDEGTGVRECTMVLLAEENAAVQLTVSYVVMHASWSPSYDIRMFMSDGKMKIQYYGQVRQITGEDWQDAKLFLSTASPSLGGSIPSLATLQLSIRKELPMKSGSLRGWFNKCGNKKREDTKMDYMDARMVMYDEEFEEEPFLTMENPQMSVAAAEVTEGVTSTTYEIARPSTIPSDNSEHRVTVGLIDVVPELQYVTVPKVAPQAFLQAHVTNKSSFALLPGPTSVFLDNAFVAKAQLKAVAPQEAFECSLGVDPSVRVNYKPLKKFSATSGLLSKTSTTTHEQTIEIKNLHEYKIKITVRDQLPRSTEDKIKVQLLEPSLDLKHPEKTPGVRLTKANHLEWELELDKQETREILAKYVVELPKGEELVSNEVFSSD